MGLLHTRRGFVAALGLTLLAAIGCDGSPVGTVSGRVTCAGKPIKGQISFVPSSGGSAITVNIDPNGSYVADGVPIGQMAVTVVGTDVPDLASQGQALKASKGRVGQQMKSVVPERYSDPRTSDLSCTVHPGPNAYDPPLRD